MTIQPWPLPPTPDPDGDHICDSYMGVIRDAITNHPRSLQTRIGPSELAHPCARRIGYKLLGIPETNTTQDTPWLPTIGTGVHIWLEDAFTADSCQGDGPARWIVETRVSVGEVGGTEITGSADLYDRATGTVIDHKIVGPTPLKKYKTRGPGAQYRGQGHLYGRGFTRLGLPVNRIMIAFLPRNGELRDAYLWSEPYNEQIALDALQRVEGIHLTTQALGTQALNLLPTADAYCTRCDWFARGPVAAPPGTPRDASTSCPGHPAGDHERRQDPVLSLI